VEHRDFKKSNCGATGSFCTYKREKTPPFPSYHSFLPYKKLEKKPKTQEIRSGQKLYTETVEDSQPGSTYLIVSEKTSTVTLTE
jgi:hypothetical protein